MSSGLIRQAEMRKLQPEPYVDVAHILQVRDKDEKDHMAKRRDVEGRHIEGKPLGEDDYMVCSSIKDEVPEWLPYPPHKVRQDTAFQSSPPSVGIPTGPKAFHHTSSRPSSLIDIRTLCTPQKRSLFTWEINNLATLQTKVDKAIAGTGPSLRILANIPVSIQLTVQQKGRVYAAQEKLDTAILKNRMGGRRRSGNVVKKAALVNSSQHDIRSGHDSDGWIVLTLPPLHLSDSLDGSLIAKSMWMEVNSLLAQLKRERVKISFSAADRETLRIHI
jgi:hypothetical protein